jgi:hypothetical protein
VTYKLIVSEPKYPKDAKELLEAVSIIAYPGADLTLINGVIMPLTAVITVCPDKLTLVLVEAN